MAKIFYHRVNNENIRLVTVGDPINKTELSNELTTINNELGRPDEEKLASLRAGESQLDLATYNDNLQDDADVVMELIDYWDHPTATISYDEILPLYITPDSVESFCAEDVGNPAANTIDGDNGTWWQDSTNHTHEIIFRIRSYTKRVIGFQIRRGNNVRSELTDLEARVAKSLGGLNNDNSILVTGATLPTVLSWNEIVATKKQRGKFIKLTFNSAHANNEARIREFQVLVEPIKNL